MIIKPLSNISAEVQTPPDKSITHRAVIFGCLAEGRTAVYNYLDADDCQRTINSFVSMGIRIDKYPDKLIIEGRGMKGLNPPGLPLDAGNSGTTIRLLSGVLAAQNFRSEIFGDSSLSKRPMRRVLEPLRKMGVEISAAGDQYPPLVINGNPRLKPITYKMPVASAQVKSCVLFAGMQANGTTVIKQPVISRDHTERMFAHFGVNLETDGGEIRINGPVSFGGREVRVPGDFSSAAFFMVLGLLLPGSKIRITNVNLNPTRTGLLEVLRKMNANIGSREYDASGGEPCGDITAESSRLEAVELSDPRTVANMIDEIPLLCLAATQARGETVIRNAGELRVKESDRIKAVCEGLKKMGADITELADGLRIKGPTALRGAAGLQAFGDHRIAMMLSVAGAAADGVTEIDNTDCVNISFPKFYDILNGLGK